MPVFSSLLLQLCRTLWDGGSTTLDHRYKKNQSSRNAHEASSRHDTSGGQNSGNRDTGNGGRGRGNGGRGFGGRRNFGRGPGGRGSGGRGNAGRGRSNGWLPRDKYFALSREERERRRNQYNNDNNNNNDSSGAPRSYNNSNQSSVNNNNGGGSNMSGSQFQQRSTNSSQQDHNNGSSNPSPGTMVRNMVSNASARSANNFSTNEQEVMCNGRHYRLAVTYRISQADQRDTRGSLVDGGANGGMFGDDVRVLEFVEHATVDITGINNAEVNGLRIAQGAAVVETINDGPIIVIMLQYANLGHGKTIHSKGQMENFGIVVDDRARSAGRTQCVITTEGYVIPLHIRDGLPRFDMHPPTDEEMEKFPHVFLTSDANWDPRILDEEFGEEFHDSVMELPEVQERRDSRDPRVDAHGNLRCTWDEYQLLFNAADEHIAANMRPVEYEERWYNASNTGV
eukprot:scaffold15918_cov194-Amphora_coffeaeformis.AAC.1